jgi:hypothetical protein
MITGRILKKFSTYDEDKIISFEKDDEVYVIAVIDNQDYEEGKAFVCVFHDKTNDGWESMSISSTLVETVSAVRDLFDNEMIPHFEL